MAGIIYISEPDDSTFFDPNYSCLKDVNLTGAFLTHSHRPYILAIV